MLEITRSIRRGRRLQIILTLMKVVTQPLGMLQFLNHKVLKIKGWIDGFYKSE